MDPKSGAGMESGRANQPVAAPFASSWAGGGWPLPRGTAMSLGEGRESCTSPGGQKCSSR